MKANRIKKKTTPKKTIKFYRYFRHHITGKVYDAYDYGHKGWPIGRTART